ncbi:hypothetical protein ACFV6F_28000, partial [Kitasatospora phosalacinea]
MGNLADTYGTDVEIYRGSNGLVRADCRTPTPGLIDRILRRFGFTAPTDPASYHLPPEQSDPDQRLAASGAAGGRATARAPGGHTPPPRVGGGGGAHPTPAAAPHTPPPP